MLLWLVIACLLSTTATAFQCGKVPFDDVLESRVVGGHASAEGNWPFIAFMGRLSNGHTCSGSIVGRRHVLTAAHCVDNSKHPMPERINASDFRVHTGSVWISRIPRMVKKVFTGPSWATKQDNHNWVDDIAILELEESIEFDDYAQPICLPKSFRERPGDPGYFVGWGLKNIVPEPHNETDYDWTGVANENIVTFRKSSHCINKDDVPVLHREDYICAGQYMRLAQSSDSGGPLMVNRKGVWFQVGTDSKGLRGEGRGQGMFARVTSYCKWFKDVTKGEVNCVKI